MIGLASSGSGVKDNIFCAGEQLEKSTNASEISKKEAGFDICFDFIRQN
jgi:hypothetical protein